MASVVRSREYRIVLKRVQRTEYRELESQLVFPIIDVLSHSELESAQATPILINLSLSLYLFSTLLFNVAAQLYDALDSTRSDLIEVVVRGHL